jgi:hypothetical protein
MPCTLQEAVALIEAGEDARARACLVELLKAEPKNDSAWVWMSTVVEDHKLKEKCLKEALKHNPRNKLAQRALAQLKETRKERPRSSGADRRRGAVEVLGWVLCAAPVPLVFLGGCLGGALGGAAAGFNLMLHRSRLPGVVRLPVMVLLVLVAYGAYVVVVQGLFGLSLPE